MADELLRETIKTLRDDLDSIGWCQQSEADQTPYHDAIWQWIKTATRTLEYLERVVNG